MNCTCGTCVNCKTRLSQPSPQFNNGGGVGQPQMSFEQFNAGQHTPIYTGQPQVQQQPIPAQVAPAVQAAPVTNVAPTVEEDPEWAFLNSTIWELIYVGIPDPMKEEIVTNVAPQIMTNPVTPTVTPEPSVEPTPSVTPNTEATV